MATDNASLVYGEAPESDEEVEIQFDDKVNTKDNFKMEMASDRTDSNPEVVDINNLEVASSNKVENEKDNSLKKSEDRFKNSSVLQKKLQQKNKMIHENLISFKKQLLADTNRDLGNVNQQLLRSQIELQESLSCVKTANINLEHINLKLKDIIAARYIPLIDIKVPPPII